MSEFATPALPSPLQALHVFAAHLEAKARSGETRLFMRPEAREALKEICRMKPGRRGGARSAPPVAAAPRTASTVQALAPDAAGGGAGSHPGPQSGASGPELQRSIPAFTSSAQRPVIPSTPALPRAEREAALAEIAKRAEASPAARALGTLRQRMVFAVGNPEAELMLVGEAPGEQEERLGEPFVGPAGQTLDRILKAMGLDRSGVYISNVCKFRPSTGSGQGSSNRKPTLTEMQTCLEYVHEEMGIVRPKVIVALGATAAEGLLQRPVTVGSVRGRWLDCRGVPLMVTYHPSYLLRCEDKGPEAAMAEKRKCWEDMLKVMERMDLPISDKQRAYFLTKSKS